MSFFQSSALSDVLKALFGSAGFSVRSCHGTPVMAVKTTRSGARAPGASLQSSWSGDEGRLAAKRGLVQLFRALYEAFGCPSDPTPSYVSPLRSGTDAEL